MNTHFLPIAFLNKEFLPFDQATISIATHSLHYGTSAFGGIRSVVHPTKADTMLLFRIKDHSKRLEQSGTFLLHSIDADYIESTIKEFIIRNKPKKDIYIRPLLYTSDLGIAPKLNDLKKDLLIYGMELGDYFSHSVRCCFSSWARQSDTSLPLRGKISGAYITSALAKSEAISRGFDEAIMFNSRGKVSEGSGMNLFLVRDGVLITPSITQDILEGITRRSVITIAKDLGLKVEEREVDKTELMIADEVFLTGTAVRITSVNAIENYTLPEDTPITKEIQHIFSQTTLGLVDQYSDWIDEVVVS